MSGVEVQTMSNTKQKKAIRARMKRTGESYSTARMHHLAKLERDQTHDSSDGVTAITTCEKKIVAGTTARHLRLDVGTLGVRVVLDGLDLGEFAARVVAGKAYVPDGEYPLTDGWGVRVEGEYEEPDLELGTPGGWRTGGQVALLPPPEQDLLNLGRRWALVSMSFRTDGSLCGWGGTGTVPAQGRNDSNNGRIESVVRKTIALAQAANERDLADSGLVTGDFHIVRPEDWVERALGRTEEEEALNAFLSSLEYGDLLAIKCVMYAGRGDGTVLGMAGSLPQEQHDLTVSVIADKQARLPEYLEQGLEGARTQGVVLDDLATSLARRAPA